MDIDKIIELVLKDAEDRREGAGMSGSYSDGGASDLETQVEYYRYGRDGDLPPDWRKYAKEAKDKADPEYEQYLRLKGKFG